MGSIYKSQQGSLSSTRAQMGFNLRNSWLGWLHWARWAGVGWGRWLHWAVWHWLGWLNWAVWHRGAAGDPGGAGDGDSGGVDSWDGEGGSLGDDVGAGLVGEGGWLWAVGGEHSLVGLDSGWVDWCSRGGVARAMSVTHSSHSYGASFAETYTGAAGVVELMYTGGCSMDELLLAVG